VISEHMLEEIAKRNTARIRTASPCISPSTVPCGVFAQQPTMPRESACILVYFRKLTP
jgi:hypothetical protein